MAHGQRILPTETTRLSVPMDLSTLLGPPYVYDVSQMAQVTVQGVSRGTTAWTASGIITITRSNDGLNGDALETAQTLTGDAKMSDAFDVAFNYIILAVTDAESGVFVEPFVWGVPLV